MKCFIEFGKRQDGGKRVVYKGKKTVVVQDAVIRLDKMTSIAMIMNTPIGEWIRNYPGYDPYNGIIYLSAVGRAVCSDDDMFNNDFGYKLADTRANQKIFNQASHFFNGLRELLDTFINNEISDADTVSVDSMMLATDHINDLENDVKS